MKLRPYQDAARARIIEKMRAGRSVLAIGPCGCGKTELAASVISDLGEGRWLFVVTIAELRKQTVNRFRGLGLDASEFGGDVLSDDDGARVLVSTVQMLLERDAGREINPAWICFDEAHHFEASEWALIRKRYPNAVRLGLTATAQRGDGIGLGRSFDEVVEISTYSELIREGFLVPARLYSPPKVPSGLAMDPIDAYQVYSEKSRAILSFGRIEDARQHADAFNAIGVRAACVDGDSPKAWRSGVVDEFRDGKLDVLTSVYVLAEGFDVPDVRTVILCRRFQFVGTYVQFVGRALRAAPGKKDAIVIDLAGASLKHGPPDQDRVWDLDDKERVCDNESTPREVTSRPEHELSVSNEGLVRVLHGALAETDPDPQPVDFPKRSADAHFRRRMGIIEARAKKIAAKKGTKLARAWAERERSRARDFDVTL